MNILNYQILNCAVEGIRHVLLITLAVTGLIPEKSASIFVFIERQVCTSDPRVIDKLLACDTPALTNFKELVNDLPCIFGDILGYREVSFLNFMVQIGFAGSLERKHSSQHYKQEHSKGPHIHCLSIVFFFHGDFRSHVRRSPTEYLELLNGRAHTREPEVNNLNHVGLFFD